MQVERTAHGREQLPELALRIARARTSQDHFDCLGVPVSCFGPPTLRLAGERHTDIAIGLVGRSRYRLPAQIARGGVIVLETGVLGLRGVHSTVVRRRVAR